MINPKDAAYQATKLIKQGKASIDKPLDELAEFIQSEFGVVVLNVIYEKANDLRPCRLEVVLETIKDEQTFRLPSGWWEKDKAKEESIIEQFLRAIQTTRDQYPKLFVIYSAFQKIALMEIFGGVKDEQRQALLKKINNPDLWHIDSLFSGVTFFFYHDSHKDQYESSDEFKQYADDYFALLKPHDEFGYLAREQFRPRIDSKENFDKNYNGNWHNYYK